jgi:hypothetical protein
MSKEELDGKGREKRQWQWMMKEKVTKEKKLTTPFNLIFHQ